MAALGKRFKPEQIVNLLWEIVNLLWESDVMTTGAA